VESLPPVIYLDHAATSWPKPPSLTEEFARLFSEPLANAGRSGHRASVRAARILFETRERLARLLGVARSENLIFTRGATEGLNLILKGFLKPGDRVLVSPLEHNAAMRPLARLERERGIVVEVLPADAYGRIDPAAARRHCAGSGAALLAVAHASNANGAVQDLAALREAMPDVPLLIDAAQTAGVLAIDLDGLGIDFLCCSAHKGLLGPMGVGACYISPRYDVLPLCEGGTGSNSESFEHPEFRPDRYEAGTQNAHGIAGLGAVLATFPERGLLGDHKRALSGVLIEGLKRIGGVRVVSPDDGTALLASFEIEGWQPNVLTERLEEEHGILCRPGLHCAPAAHRHLGAFPAGTVRLSPGWGNTERDVETALRAVKDIIERGDARA
jgi:cysteine desulfurase family protein